MGTFFCSVSWVCNHRRVFWFFWWCSSIWILIGFGSGGFGLERLLFSLFSVLVPFLWWCGCTGGEARVSLPDLFSRGCRSCSCLLIHLRCCLFVLYHVVCSVVVVFCQGIRVEAILGLPQPFGGSLLCFLVCFVCVCLVVFVF